MSISSISGISQLSQTLANRQNLPVSSASTSSSTGFSTPSADAAAHSIANTPLAQAQAYFKESPAQRLEDNWLSQHGITKAQFNAMSGVAKQKLVDQMQQDIQAKLKQKLHTSSTTPDSTATPGSSVDFSA